MVNTLVAGRAQRDHVVEVVGATVREPAGVVGLEVGLTIPRNEGCCGVASLRVIA